MASAISNYYDADAFRAWVDAGDLDGALRMWRAVRLKATNTGSVRTGPDRRGRAAEINALKRAVEKATGYRLVLESKSYSESMGFTHLSTFTYRIER